MDEQMYYFEMDGPFEQVERLISLFKQATIVPFDGEFAYIDMTLMANIVSPTVDTADAWDENVLAAIFCEPYSWPKGGRQMLSLNVVGSVPLADLVRLSETLDECSFGLWFDEEQDGVRISRQVEISAGKYWDE